MTIRLRLTCWYAGSILLIFAAVAAMLWLSVREILVREQQRAAERTVEIVQAAFEIEMAEYITVLATAGHVSNEVVPPDQRLQFFDPEGVPQIRGALPPGVAESLEAPVHVLERPLHEELAPGWTIEVRSSSASVHRQLRRVLLAMLLIAPLIVGLAAISGWWLTGRTLDPVGRMARAAEAITSSDPSGRIPVVNPQDELGRLALGFNALLTRLDEALGQQRRFLADAAHELRTPIARMQSEVDVAGRGGEGAASEALSRIREELRSMGTLVAQLLQLARADAGEMGGEREYGYLDDLVSSAVQPWYRIAEQNGVLVTVAELEEAPVWFSPVEMERVIGVLIDNAIRYSPWGATVEVAVRREGDVAVLEVRDTGIGISPEERPRLFERFFRGNEARRRAPEGSGLGLAIALWTVRQHGGTIELLDREGGGTRVRITLPIGNESHPPDPRS